jgi:hypothetical protein
MYILTLIRAMQEGLVSFAQLAISIVKQPLKLTSAMIKQPRTRMYGSPEWTQTPLNLY